MINMVHMSNYYNLRFGYCNSKSKGDFIDNINGALNIYVANGMDENSNEYLLLYYNNKFSALTDSSIDNNLEKLSKSLNTIFSEDIAKALIKSGYDNDSEGIITHSTDYENHYFNMHDEENVNGFTPCFFVVASVTYKCSCKVNIETGNINYKDEKIDNLSDFYGYLDEDQSYALGIMDYKKLI
jgi:hypothetical protein